MNDQLEIGGDLQDEYLEIQEGEECNRLAPMSAPMSDAELDDWASLSGDTPDLIEDENRPGYWRFVSVRNVSFDDVLACILRRSGD